MVTVFQEFLCHLSVTHPICKGLLFLQERLKKLKEGELCYKELTFVSLRYVKSLTLSPLANT